jgi:hypothetical protein
MTAIARLYAGDVFGALEDALEAAAAAKRVNHQRAEIIAHHAAYMCRHELMELAHAWGNVEAALELARHIGARRFEAEALAFRAELHRLSGRRTEALTDVGEALAISRETGMAFVGPWILGILLLVNDDPGARSRTISEAETLLRAGSPSHNQFEFRRCAIDICIETGDWDGAEVHAAALKDYTLPEPLPWTDLVIARGRALAAYGRGKRDPKLLSELGRLENESQRLGLRSAQPTIMAVRARFRNADSG